MASVTFKTTDGVKRTIGWSYIFGYDTGRVAQAISKIDAMLQTLGKCRSVLVGMASTGDADSIRDHYLNYVYVGEYEDLLKGYIEKIDEAIKNLNTARANLKLLNEKREAAATEIANHPFFS